jgi:hypothetical protein
MRVHKRWGSSIKITAVLSTHPSRQAICNVTGITMRRNSILQIPRAVDATTIVEPCCSIKVRLRSPAALVDTLRQTISIRCPSCPISNHLSDGRIRARGVNLAGEVRIAGPGAVVILHQAWVADAIVGSRNSNAAAGLLDDSCEDKAVVDSRLGGNGFNCVPDGANLGPRVVLDTPSRAGGEHDGFVGIEPVCVKLWFLRMMENGTYISVKDTHRSRVGHP